LLRCGEGNIECTGESNTYESTNKQFNNNDLLIDK